MWLQDIITGPSPRTDESSSQPPATIFSGEF